MTPTMTANVERVHSLCKAPPEDDEPACGKGSDVAVVLTRDNGKGGRCVWTLALCDEHYDALSVDLVSGALNGVSVVRVKRLT